MAQVVITLKIMPESPDVDLDGVRIKVEELIEKTTGPTDIKTNEEPVAFGIRMLQVIFVADESKGSTDDLEKEISELDGVNSVEVTDVRRAIG